MNAFIGGRGKTILIGIVTRVGAVKRGVLVRIPSEAMYLSPKRQSWLWDLHSLLCNRNQSLLPKG
jgi:hypothetical protein